MKFSPTENNSVDALPETASGEPVFAKPPLHMDRFARNQRLYETLLGLGLFVEPIPHPTRRGGIDCFLVSAERPDYEPHVQG